MSRGNISPNDRAKIFQIYLPKTPRSKEKDLITIFGIGFTQPVELFTGNRTINSSLA